MYVMSTRLSAPMMSPIIRLTPVDGVITIVCDFVVYAADVADLLMIWGNATDQNTLDHLASEQLVKSFSVFLVVSKWKWVNLAVASTCGGLQYDGHCVRQLFA